MAAVRVCLQSNMLRSKSARSVKRVVTSLFSNDCEGPWNIRRTYCSSSQETSHVQEDPRNKPIRFSTSKARYMSLNQTLGYGADIERNSSKKSIYAGLIGMAIMTYIIFFLPADEEDDLDLLEETDIATGQSQERR